MTDATVLPVQGASPYEVIVGHGVSHRLPDLLGTIPQRVALIVGEPLLEVAEPVREALDAHYEVTLLPIPEGEGAKDAAVAVECWEALGDAGFTRSDAVVTFGGGATTDVGGFVAATWLRGVRVVHVPTTLLAMVDAAVGGKTGINTSAGKNLVGSFHEPAGVLCDLSFLETLPREDLVAGFGEVVKCGFIADPEILRLVETSSDEELFDAGSPVLRELIERAIAVKIDVVVADLRETGGNDGHPGREALNYGHTLGHAIERAEGYRMRHGEAVSIGCVYVAELSRRAGLLTAAAAARHAAAFAAVGLPTSYDGAGFEELHEAMKVDKKSRGNQLRFVVLTDTDGPMRPVVLAGPSDADLLDSYLAIGGRA